MDIYVNILPVKTSFYVGFTNILSSGLALVAAGALFYLCKTPAFISSQWSPVSTKRKLQDQAARAREGQRAHVVIEISSDSESEGDVTSWAGGVNNPVDDRRFPYSEEWESSSADIRIVELDGPDLFNGIEQRTEHELAQLEGCTRAEDKPKSRKSLNEKLCTVHPTS